MEALVPGSGASMICRSSKGIGNKGQFMVVERQLRHGLQARQSDGLHQL
jgi:hypothetical protein